MNLSHSKLGVGALFAAFACASAFAQVSNFDSLNGYAAGLETRLAGSRNLVLRMDNADFQSNVILAGSYLDRDIGAATDRLERSSNESSFMLGYNWAGNGWRAGAAIAADQTSSDYVEVNSPAPQPLRGSVDGDTFRGVFWVGTRLENFSINGVASFGNTSNDGVRRSDIGTSRADYDSDIASFGIRFAYHSSLGETVEFTPFAALNFASADADGFTEQGTSPDRRILRDFSMKDNRLIIGARFSGKESSWTPFGTIAWMNRISDSGSNISSSAINGSNLGSGFVPSASKNLFYFSAGMRGKLDENWVLDGALDYSTGDEEKQFGVALSVRRLF